MGKIEFGLWASDKRGGRYGKLGKKSRKLLEEGSGGASGGLTKARGGGRKLKKKLVICRT